MIARLVISQNSTQIKQEVQKSLLLSGLSNPHPDLLYFDSSQKLGIEQARKVKQFLSLKPFSAKGKAVVLEDASKLTAEAQNSLLKTLEELSSECLFILGAKSDVNFLPTILSRCQIIKLDQPAPNQGGSGPATPEVERLIQMGIADRFEYIEKLKDRQQFLLDLTAFFRDKMVKEPENREIFEFVKNLMLAQEWAAQNVNIRAILEYLMLVMPDQI